MSKLLQILIVSNFLHAFGVLLSVHRGHVYNTTQLVQYGTSFVEKIINIVCSSCVVTKTKSEVHCAPFGFVTAMSGPALRVCRATNRILAMRQNQSHVRTPTHTSRQKFESIPGVNTQVSKFEDTIKLKACHRFFSIQLFQRIIK